MVPTSKSSSLHVIIDVDPPVKKQPNPSEFPLEEQRNSLADSRKDRLRLLGVGTTDVGSWRPSRVRKQLEAQDKANSLRRGDTSPSLVPRVRSLSPPTRDHGSTRSEPDLRKAAKRDPRKVGAGVGRGRAKSPAPSGRPVGTPGGYMGQRDSRQRTDTWVKVDREFVPRAPPLGSQAEFAARYETTKKLLGKGSYSKVFLGYTKASPRMKVAIKVMSIRRMEQSRNHEQERKNLLREIDLMLHIDHSNIVKCYGIYKTARSYFFVMEYMGGGTLWSRAASRGCCDEEGGRTLVRHILHGLKYLHGQKIAHRDIKLANILLLSKKDPWTVKLADFGYVGYVNMALNTNIGGCVV